MNCIFCARPIAKDDKVLQVYRFTFMRYGVPHVIGEPEPAHVRCEEPARRFSHEPIPQKALVVYNGGPTMRVSPSHQCLFCGVAFRADDRIIEVIRVQGIALDPETSVQGVLCDDDREYAHARCDDRDAKQGTYRTKVVLS